MKKSIVIFICIGFLFSPYSSFALSSKLKGQILKNFKAQEYKMLFESDRVFLDSSTEDIFDASRKMQLYKGVRENVVEKREFLEEENIKIINKISNLQDSVAILDNDIANIREETVKINNQIIDLTKKLSVTKNTIELLKNKIEENKKVLYEYITYLYKKGNYLFKDGEVDNFKAIFFSGEDISSVLNDLHFKGIMQITAQRLIDKHRSYVSDLYVKKIALSKAELESKSLRKQLMVKKAMMNQKKEFKEKLITLSEGKQKIYAGFIEEKRQIENKLKGREFQERLKFKTAKKELLDDEGCEFVDFSRINANKGNLSDKCTRLNTIIYIESQLKGFETDDAGNIFKRPVAPTKGVSTLFHDEGYIKMFGEDHDALDIPTKQGTSIKAPADGYVILVNKPKNLDYSFLALKHSDGYVTVYGHLSDISVEELDFVKQGEEFAKTGGAIGTKGAGLMTTGPHLHFEVWKDKKISDPLDFLDTSVLLYDELPDKYVSKYKRDFKARKGYEFKGKKSEKRETRTFKIEGDTEIERQKNFLLNYGVGGFRSWSLWVEAGIDYDIDPTFIMCVGLAETSLGKNLKTPFNVGNVGNTDSGATKDFLSPEDGVRAMVKTFNNKYLGKYTEIKQLSRYGNETGTIYASSESNWHNNIVSCMSHIKGRFVSDDFNFRLK